MKTTLIIPTINEIIGVKQILPMIKKEWVEQIIIIDGGSTDGTVEYCRENGYFVFVQKQMGMRYAYMEALQYVTGDIIVTFSPDGNCIPEIIPVLVAQMKKGYDMVIASRYLKDAKSYDDDQVTSFGNSLFTSLVNLLYNVHYTDVMGIYRAYKKELIYTLDLDKDSSYTTPEKIFKTNISWEPLLSVRAAKRKLKVLDIPADEPARLGGERKLQVFKWGAAYLFQIIREAFRKK